MNLLQYTKERCPELAEFLEACCNSSLNFEGEYPLNHSSHNHIHLWALEYWADDHAWIDLEYRNQFLQCIFNHWRGRLKRLAPYRQSGFRLYLYEDMAPTISVVAETPSGFPYSGEPRYVKRPQDIMQLYIGRSWRKRFSSEPWPIASRRIVNAIERNAGSIAKPSADALKLKVSAMRIMIEQMGLEDEVNAIRKRFNRRPAKFRPEDLSQAPYHLYELRLPAGFR